MKRHFNIRRFAVPTFPNLVLPMMPGAALGSAVMVLSNNPAEVTGGVAGIAYVFVNAYRVAFPHKDPISIPVPWITPPPATTATPRREPSAYPPSPGQCFVCGMIDPEREQSLGTANHPECVEWLGDWKPPVPHFEGRNRHLIILPSRSGITMAEFANNLRGAMGPTKSTPVESTADAVRRNNHMCTVLCAHETHGDGPHDLCKCSTCVNNRGDIPTEQEIREAYDNINARYGGTSFPGHVDRVGCTCAVCKMAADYAAHIKKDAESLLPIVAPGRLRQSLDGHTPYPADMPPSQFLGYTAYPKHGYYIRSVCQACKLIADYTARPQWISKLPPFEPDPDLTKRIKE